MNGNLETFLVDMTGELFVELSDDLLLPLAFGTRLNPSGMDDLAIGVQNG